MSKKVHFKGVSLITETIKLVRIVNLKDFHPQFLLHLLPTITREQTNLKKELEEPPYQVFTQFTSLKAKC